MKPSIFSIGSINVDLQFRSDRCPEPGKTTLIGEFRARGGGKAANVAYLARSLGEPAVLLACTGDDPLAEIALSPLRTAGVDLRQVCKCPGASTGVAMIRVGSDGDKAIALAPNANEAWSLKQAGAAATCIRAAPKGSVLVCDLEVSPHAAAQALEAARAAGIAAVSDPSPAERLDDALLRGIDYLTPNPVECESLTGIEIRSVEAAFRAGRDLRERGVRTVLVKLKDGGCAVTAPEGSFLVAAPPAEPIDKTGAGDAFAGALAVGLLRRLPLPEAARMAVATSSIAVTRYGSQAAYPDERELGDWMRRMAS